MYLYFVVAESNSQKVLNTVLMQNKMKLFSFILVLVYSNSALPSQQAKRKTYIDMASCVIACTVVIFN